MSEQSATLHRCFYALRFAQGTIEYLTRLVEELRAHGADVAWVRRENLHLTLRFLGEITDEQLERAIALPETSGIGAISLRAEGLGAFPGLRNAKVVWAGVAASTSEERARLEQLQSRTERWSRQLGLAPENRRYRPHITLGRIRRPGENLRELVDDITTRACSSPASQIEELVLMRSVLGSSGSVYDVVGRWRLG